MRWRCMSLLLAGALAAGCAQTRDWVSRPDISNARASMMRSGQETEPTRTRGTARASQANYEQLSYEQPAEPAAIDPPPTPAPANDDGTVLPAPELLSPGVELWELEEIALSSNPAIGAARARLETLCGRWVQAGLPPNPFVGYSGQQLGSRGQAEQQGVIIGQEFIRGKKLQLDRQVVNQELSRAEQQLAIVQTRVITDVRISFYETVIAQRQLELAHQLLDVAEKGIAAAEALLAAKEVSRLDTLQMSVERDTAQIMVTTAENRMDAAWRRLAAAVGQPELPRNTVSDPLDPATPMQWDHALERIKGQSPEVAAAMSSIEQARWALLRAEAEPIPNISVEGIVQQDNATGSSNGNLQVTFPLPLWNRNQGGIRAAYGELSAAERELDRIELRLERRLAEVYERYVNALNQVQRYEKDILPKAEESLELVSRGYAAGEFDYLKRLTAQRTYFQTNGLYLDALRQWKTAEAEIEGLLLQDALEAD